MGILFLYTWSLALTGNIIFITSLFLDNYFLFLLGIWCMSISFISGGYLQLRNLVSCRCKCHTMENIICQNCKKENCNKLPKVPFDQWRLLER